MTGRAVAGPGVFRPWAAALLAAPLLLASCVMPDDLARLRKDVADVQQQIAKSRAEQDETRKRLAALEKQASSGDPVTRQEFADLQAQQRDLASRVGAVDEKLEVAGRRMDRIVQDVQTNREVARRAVAEVAAVPAAAAGAAAGTAAAATAAAPSPAPVAAPGGAVPNPDALYNSAYADFSKGNFPLAISGFEEYASRFPESPLADNALYWVGECRFSQGNFAGAVEAYDRMLGKYPESEKAAAANLKKGLAYLEQNKVKEAAVQFRYVETTYPGTDESKIARDRLAGLGKAPPGR